MVTTLIVNASPLIGLGKGGLLWLLESGSFEVHIPRPVAEEILVHGADTASGWLRLGGHSRVVDAVPVDPLLLAWDLGPGETSVVAHACLNRSGVVVLDDLAARRCAHALGLRCTGTLGFLLMAKKRGLISTVMPSVGKLREAGIYIGDALVQSVRVAAGEA